MGTVWFFGNVRPYQTGCSRTAGHWISEKPEGLFLLAAPWLWKGCGVVLDGEDGDFVVLVVVEVSWVYAGVGDDVWYFVEAGKAGEGSFVEFSFVGQEVDLEGILYQVVVKRQLGPVDDGVSVVEVDAVYRDEDFVEV